MKNFGWCFDPCVWACVCECACSSARSSWSCLLLPLLLLLFLLSFEFFWFFLISLPSSSSQQRGWSTRTHFYKTEEYAETNFTVAHKTSSTQLHCVLPLCLRSPSDKIWMFQPWNFTDVLRWSMHPTLKRRLLSFYIDIILVYAFSSNVFFKAGTVLYKNAYL